MMYSRLLGAKRRREEKITALDYLYEERMWHAAVLVDVFTPQALEEKFYDAREN